jgi:hypothetical protein
MIYTCSNGDTVLHLLARLSADDSKELEYIRIARVILMTYLTKMHKRFVHGTGNAAKRCYMIFIFLTRIMTNRCVQVKLISQAGCIIHLGL